jgi:hypothetical protein
MIHQRLYPSRWTQNAFNSQQNSSQIRRTTVPRSKHLSSAFNYGHSSDKDFTPKLNGCDLDEALERYRIYQRRLIDIVPPTTTTNNHFNENTKSLDKSSILIENVEQNQINLHRTTSAPINHSKQQIPKPDSASKRLTSVSQLVKQQQFNVHPAPGEGRHSIYAKNDILQMLNQGLTLRLISFYFFLKYIICLKCITSSNSLWNIFTTNPISFNA